jgi:hypothetical protein
MNSTSVTAVLNDTMTTVVAKVASTKNRGEAVTDGSPLDTAYLVFAALFAFVGLQVGLGLREAGAARPHATHELLKKHVSFLLFVCCCCLCCLPALKKNPKKKKKKKKNFYLMVDLIFSCLF